MTKNRFHLLFILIAFTAILNVVNAKTNIDYSVVSSSEIDLSIELWDFVPPITDNNMTVVFPAGTLSDYPGGELLALIDGLPVSASSFISVEGSGGIAVIGTDGLCECDLADIGEEIVFAILSNGTEMTIIDVSTSVTYSANGFLIFDSPTTLVFELWEGLTVNGCTDTIACNYNPEATDFDDSCEFATENYNCDNECLNDTDTDGICDELEIVGCTDTIACNYNPEATDFDDSCEFATENYNCDNECLNDTDTDGICDELEIVGCTDTIACNYNPEATDFDDSCEFATENYNCDNECLNDTDTDGICDELEIVGCTDTIACNYNPEATDFDDSCEFTVENYNCDNECLNDTDNDGICDELEITGCLYASACNYNPEATDILCVYPVNYYNCNDLCINDTDSDGVCDELEIEGCTEEAACNYNASATEFDDACEYALEYSNCFGFCLNDTDLDGICDELEVVGCYDVNACNYNELATDVGTCVFEEMYYNCNGICLNDGDNDNVCDELEIYGCDDEIACNYSIETTEFDDSCEYPFENYDCSNECINDLNNDGVCDENEVEGCLDIEACNYNESTTIIGTCVYASEYLDCNGICLNDLDNDNVCDELEIPGCQDTIACNFNPLATDSEEGACEYSAAYYNCNGGCTSDIDNDGICDELEIFGCIDLDACNYNEFATEADSSCYIVNVELSYVYPEPLIVITNAISPTFTWFYNDVQLSFTESQITPPVNGVYEVLVVDEIDCEGSTILPIYSVGVSELINTPITIYPNPVQNLLYVNLGANTASVELHILNTVGAVVLSKTINSTGLDDEIQLQVTDLPKGVYFLNIKTEGLTQNIPWLKN